MGRCASNDAEMTGQHVPAVFGPCDVPSERSSAQGGRLAVDMGPDNNDAADSPAPVAVELRSSRWYGQGPFSFEHRGRTMQSGFSLKDYRWQSTEPGAGRRAAGIL